MESAEQEKQEPKLELIYTLFCDDVRLEVGNKLSYMGVFQNIVVPQLPVWLPQLAVVNHWRGGGAHLSQVRILIPDPQEELAASPPPPFLPSPHSPAILLFFVHVDFSLAGQHLVLTP